MVSFDALRASHVGAVSYLCKEMKPDFKLQFLCNMQNQNDLSKKQNLFSMTGYTGPLEGISGDPVYKMETMSLTLENSLRSDNPWSFETEICSIPNGSTSYGYRINIGTWNMWHGCNSSRAWINTRNDSYTSERSIGIHHIAVENRSGNLYLYIDGNRVWTNSTSSLIGTSNRIYIEKEGGCNVFGFRNVRVTSSLLGNGTTFPVPDRLYTGYEPL